MAYRISTITLYIIGQQSLKNSIYKVFSRINQCARLFVLSEKKDEKGCRGLGRGQLLWAVLE